MRQPPERINPNEDTFREYTPVNKEHVARYNFASRLVTGKKVLDIACGTGYGSKILFDAGAEYVVGGDISEDAINYAKKEYSSDLLEFRVMDATKIDYPTNIFDCIVSNETIEHIKDSDAVLKEFCRVLKNDGVLFITTPNKNRLRRPINPYHLREFTRDEFVRFLGQKFDHIEMYSQLLFLPQKTSKKIARFAVDIGIKLDFLNVRTKIFKGTIYEKLYDTIDDTNGNYDPVKYQETHIPKVLIAICHMMR